ncbi:hypothetical protein FVA74_12975 [Salinibacterium sp. dk2585]|uniref:hypothetical protein n=1 Tax=unclassified Salinibacterium TaxID=2632331 RepID=UPI0011C24BBF|nr:MULTISPECIES: hypothetical protein [unclassified Salinibacterium]QEE62385.1 hypothetical protein FVA74_12975 [Salinibacterium sp. dk2585]TXK52732.1 hypothetical protein FVP63_12420 [Salinibacterium sp. dk5596]
MTDITAQIAAIAVDGEETRRLELALDPAAVQLLGAAIADRAREHSPSLVLSWAGDDIVLAHAVASALGVPRAVVSLDLGLISVDPQLEAGTRGMLVASTFTSETPIASIATMLGERGHELVLAAAIEGRAADVGETPFVALN